MREGAIKNFEGFTRRIAGVAEDRGGFGEYLAQKGTIKLEGLSQRRRERRVAEVAGQIGKMG